MSSAIFTASADIIDLNEYDLDELELYGVIVSHAMAGNDVVTLSFSQNLGELFDAGNGRDIVYGSHAGDYVTGGLGNDEIYGFCGDDTLLGGNDVDRLFGGTGNDFLSGNDDRDFLYGEDGDDYLAGGKGGDFLYGGSGQDELIGADGIDFLYGEDGDDLVSGGFGADLVSGGAGSDLLYGGRGGDTFTFAGAELNDSQDRVVDFEIDVDTISLQAVFAADGRAIESFGDLDTNGDGVLNGSDGGVAIANGALTMSFEGGSITLSRVTELSASNFDVLVA